MMVAFFEIAIVMPGTTDLSVLQPDSHPYRGRKSYITAVAGWQKAKQNADCLAGKNPGP